MRVEVVPQEIAEDVEDEHRHHDGEAGEDDHPGGGEEVGAVQAHHGPPGRGGRLDSQAEEAQGRF